MRSTPSPVRRTAMGLAGLTLVAGGSIGLVSVASAEPATPEVASTTSIELHNATAETGTDCPADGAAYWHFVFAPNDGSAAFQTIVLELGDAAPVTFSGAAIVANGTQTDNVFVAVPAGHTLEDLRLDGSHATYTGAEPKLFNLSHVCEGEVPEETTTTTVRQPEVEQTTTTTTVEDSTTTTVEDSTTTTVEDSTTTTVEDSTTTTTVEEPVVEDTVVEDTTTTTAPPDDTVVDDTTTTPPPGEAPTGQPAGPASPQVATPVTTTGTLPYTGADAAGLAVAGLAVVAGGLVLTAAARSRASASRR